MLNMAWVMLAARVVFYLGAEATYEPNTPWSKGGWGQPGSFERDLKEFFSSYWYYCTPGEDSILRVILLYFVAFNLNSIVSGGGLSVVLPTIMLVLYLAFKGSRGVFHVIELLVICMLAAMNGPLGTIVFLIEERFCLAIVNGLRGR